MITALIIFLNYVKNEWHNIYIAMNKAPYCKYCDSYPYSTYCASYFRHLRSCEIAYECGKSRKTSEEPKGGKTKIIINNITVDNRQMNVNFVGIYPNTSDVQAIMNAAQAIIPNSLENVNDQIGRIYDEFPWFGQCMNSNGTDGLNALMLYHDMLGQISRNCDNVEVSDALSSDMEEVRAELDIKK